MKPIDEQDHYEVLEVPPGAGPDDIERAYRLTRAAYTDGSIALYSIFSRDDAAVIRSRIDEAYRVLTSPEDRARYDAETGIEERAAAPALERVAETRPVDAFPVEYDEPEVEVRALPAELPSAIEVLDDPEAEMDESGVDFDGAALRRARLRRGVELDQISDVTKISVRFLQYLEDDAFDPLPASVYVRGFVAAYARAIGLDARRVASSYMEKVDAVRERPRRSTRSSHR